MADLIVLENAWVSRHMDLHLSSHIEGYSTSNEFDVVLNCDCKGCETKFAEFRQHAFLSTLDLKTFIIVSLGSSCLIITWGLSETTGALFSGVCGYLRNCWLESTAYFLFNPFGHILLATKSEISADFFLSVSASVINKCLVFVNPHEQVGQQIEVCRRSIHSQRCS